MIEHGKGIGIYIERVCCAVGTDIGILIECVVLEAKGLGFLLNIHACCAVGKWIGILIKHASMLCCRQG